MPRLEYALRCLAQGEFIDEIGYPDAFAQLQTPEGYAEAKQWLEAMGYTLAQLGDNGAYFMAYGYLDPDAKTRVKEEMRVMRARLQPAVMFLETVRQAQGRGAQLQPGDLLPLDVLMGAVRADISLQQRLDGMREVPNSKAADPAADRLVHILNWLERDGYLLQQNSQHKVYQITGKIMYLYELLQFIAEHVPQLQDEGTSDQMEQQLPLTEGPADGQVPSP